jgi:hypothetical protein
MADVVYRSVCRFSPNALLGHEPRRAVVYRGPRPGRAFRPCTNWEGLCELLWLSRVVLREPRLTKDLRLITPHHRG